MNPYVKDTRPSNVPVCQFQHTRIFGRSIIIAFAVPPVNNIFLKKRDFCKISLKVRLTLFDCTRFAAGKEDLRQVGNMRRKPPTSALWKRCSHPPKKEKPALKKDWLFFWQGQKDSNPRHVVLETTALPSELYPCIFRGKLVGHQGLEPRTDRL